MAGEYIEFNNSTQPAVNDANLNRLQQLIKQDIQGAVSGDTLPVGAILPFGSDTIPENWLLCDGRAVSRTDYMQLFNTIGTTFGTGDGFTTFNLPDLRDRVPVGKDTTDTDFDTLGKTSGAKSNTYNFNHTHAQWLGFTGSYANGNGVKYTAGDTIPLNVVATHDSAWSDVSSASIGTKKTLDDKDISTVQPSIVTNYIIKASQSAGIVATVVDSLNSTSTMDALSANQGKVLVDRMSYSTTEKVVGTWYNGKILYEITIVATKVSGTDLRVTLESTFEDAFIHDGHLKSQTTDGITYALDRNEGNGIFTRSEIDILNNQFIFKSSTGNYTNGTVYVTIRYTKPDIQNS